MSVPVGDRHVQTVHLGKQTNKSGEIFQSGGRLCNWAYYTETSHFFGLIRWWTVLRIVDSSRDGWSIVMLVLLAQLHYDTFIMSIPEAWRGDLQRLTMMIARAVGSQESMFKL